jgi:hypothetical protein
LIRPMDGPSLLRAPNLTTPRGFSHIDNAPDQKAAVVTRTEEAPANKEPVMGSGVDGAWKHGFHAAGPRAEAGGDADRLIYYPIMWNKEKIPSNQEILGVCRVIEQYVRLGIWVLIHDDGFGDRSFSLIAAYCILIEKMNYKEVLAEVEWRTFGAFVHLDRMTMIREIDAFANSPQEPKYTIPQV